MKNTLIGVVVVAAVLGAAAFFGFSPFIKVVNTVLGSAVGTTFSTAKIASINISPATAAASSSSILNTDASGRWVKNIDTVCTGVGSSFTYATGAGLASNGWHLQAATTSVAGIGLAGSATLVADEVVATSSTFSQNASSTIGSTVSTGTDQYYWAAGTYLTFLFNATNTAACTVSASYIAT